MNTKITLNSYINRNISLPRRSDATQQLANYSTNIEANDDESTWLKVESFEEFQLNMVKDDMKEDLVESVPEFALYSDSEVIQYIAVYLIKKLKLNECADKNRPTGETFLYYVNNGGLKILKADFQDKIEQLEVVFKENILKKIC